MTQRLSPAMSRWLNAPGVRTGYYCWGRSADEKTAHAYRTGTRTVDGLCGYAFKRQVWTPAIDDAMCERCAKKCREMEVTLLGLSREDKAEAVKH